MGCDAAKLLKAERCASVRPAHPVAPAAKAARMKARRPVPIGLYRAAPVAPVLTCSVVTVCVPGEAAGLWDVKEFHRRFTC